MIESDLIRLRTRKGMKVAKANGRLRGKQPKVNPRLVHPAVPNLIWLPDHSWCVATEIDFMFTLIGGSEQLIDAIVADPDLDAWAIDAAYVGDGDPINT